MINLTVHALDLIITTTFVTGCAFGGWSVYMFYRTHRQIGETKQTLTIAEQSKEITRLRAQVAMIIGKEFS